MSYVGVVTNVEANMIDESDELKEIFPDPDHDILDWSTWGSRSFICHRCDKEFDKGRSDEEALKESEEIFGPIRPEQREVICDDCFHELWSKETM